MTLNITVAARWLMLQSSDFRLTNAPGGVVSETSQKQVVLHYMDWSGLVCYTGLAQYGTHNTAVWLERVLTHELGQRSPQKVLTTLIDDGNLWLRRIPAKYRRTTFTMITFERGKPHVYVISNFERPGVPPLSVPADALLCTQIRPRTPRCVVTGCSDAVTNEQRLHLTELLARERNPEQLRKAVALTSRDASTRAGGAVGESCVVAHLCPDGSGEAQVFGHLNEEFLPVFVTNGTNASMHVPAALADAGAVGKHRLVGVTWQSNSKLAMAAMVAAYRPISNQSVSGW
jgi:hypothetical protein